MGKKIFICRLSDLAGKSSMGFTLALSSREISLFIVRQGQELFGYINRCPHTGVNLDWTPNQFLDSTGTLIQCATHGAQFRIHDGFCTSGPCTGASLTAVSLQTDQDNIFLVT